MYCKQCGFEVSQQERLCSNCGENNDNYVPVAKNDYQEINQSTLNQNYNQSQYQQEYKYQQQYAPTSSAALICGIISIFFAGLILGIIGLVLASKPNAAHKTAARVTSIIGIVGWALLVILQIALNA